MKKRSLSRLADKRKSCMVQKYYSIVQRFHSLSTNKDDKKYDYSELNSRILEGNSRFFALPGVAHV